MATTNPAYRFPPRNPAFPQLSDIIFQSGIDRHEAAYKVMYDRARGDAAKLLRLKYLSVEEELERAYRYVSPCEKNADVCSVKFAEIIRAAANVYEAQCKKLYSAFYDDRNRLDVFDYLALDVFLGLASRKVVHLMAVGEFPAHPEFSQPFVNLSSWDKMSQLEPRHKPAWWSAYNAVKHDHDGIETSATLANATAAVAALFLLIETIFGFRVLSGGGINHYVSKPGPGGFRIVPKWARLFDAA